MSQIYTICTSYDSESNFPFSRLKIFCDLPTHILRIAILKNYVGVIQISISNSDSALNFTSNGMFEYRYISIVPTFSVKMIIA